MELTKEDYQLEFINESAQLSSHFIMFSKSIVDLNEKSNRILELLNKKQRQQLITALIAAKNQETASFEENKRTEIDILISQDLDVNNDVFF